MGSSRTLARISLNRHLAPLFGSVAVLLVLSAEGPAASIVSNWTTATSGTWNVPANWTNAPAQVAFPNNGTPAASTYDAVIATAGAAYTVTLNSNVTIEDLSLSSANATLSHTSGTFTTTGAISLGAGTYSLNGGTISNSTINFSGGALAFGSSNNSLLTGVTVNGDLTFDATNARTKIAGGTTFTTARLAASSTALGFAPGQTLAGTVLLEGATGGFRYVEMNGSAGTFTIGSTGVIRTNSGLIGDGYIGDNNAYGGLMTLANQGLISSQVSGRAINILAASLTNTGTLQATSSGTLTIDPTTAWSSAGNISANNGTVNVNGNDTFTNNGTLSASNGGTLTVNPTNAWTNPGTISVNNATVNLDGTFNATGGIGTFANTNGTVNIRGILNNAGSTLTLNNATGSWTLAGGTLSGGTLAFAGGNSLILTTNGNNLLTGVTVNGDLTLDTASARTRIAGGTTFTTARLAASSTALGFAPGQTLSGTVLFEGATGGNRFVEMNGSPGTFTVGPAGVIRTNAGLIGDGFIGGNSAYGGLMTLVNQGLISSQVNGRTITISAASLTNTGTLQAITNGTLTVNPTVGWSNGGNITANNATVNVNGADSFTNNGTLSASNSGTLTVNPANPWTNPGTISVNNATVNLGGTFNATSGIGTFTNTTGTVNITGTLNNAGSTLTLNNATGSWRLAGGTISGGSLAFVAGNSLTFTGSFSNLLTAVTINGDLTLNTASTRTRIEGGTTFTTARLANASTFLSFAPGQTLNGTVLFEGATGGDRFVEMNGSAGTFTIGPAGVLRTNTGLTGDGFIGNSNGVMTLVNQGLISSQVSGETITISAASLTNTGTLEAINGGLISVTNSFTQTAGTTRVANNSTISVGTGNSITIAAGRLEGIGTITANVINSGIIAPGLSAGTLAIGRDLTLGSGSSIELEVGGLTQGTQYDLLTEVGTVALTLQGSLSLRLIGGFVPSAANTFTVLTSNQALSGAFSNVANGGRLNTTDGLGSFVVNYGVGSAFATDRVVLSGFAVVPEPGCVALLGCGAALLGWRRRVRSPR